MLKLEYVIPAATIPAVATVAFLILLRRCLRRKTLGSVTPQSPHGEITALHPASPLSHPESYRRANSYRLLQPGTPAPKTPHFTWADHPSSVADAAENGWPRFAFAPPLASDEKLETSWEVCEGSTDFMQKIRLNPDSKRGVTGNNTAVIMAALPLPGPNLGTNSPFPQEAYFEITVIPKPSDEVGDVSVCVGLTGDNPPPARTPGTYQGSIGFNSTGSIYLDGSSVFESKTHLSNNVIGCGYNPSQKKVFFTVDSSLVHESHCRTESFSSPLFPTLASNDEITVLVNLGQSPFKYSPANPVRTPNPCFTTSHRALGFKEDSRELFSMGRIDSQWLQRGASAPSGFEEDSRELFSMGRIDSQWLRRGERVHNNAVSSIRASEYDQESDGDLFDIML